MKPNLKINIGNHIFELKKRLIDSSDRYLILIESTETENGKKKKRGSITRKFVVYTSKSDLGMFKLRIWDKGKKVYLKPNDYVSSTMICFELQKFIRENLYNIPSVSGRSSYDKIYDEIKNASKFKKYYYFFTHRKKCLEGIDEHILSRFEKMKNNKFSINNNFKKNKETKKKLDILRNGHWLRCGIYTKKKNSKIIKNNMIKYNFYNNYKKMKDYSGEVFDKSHINIFKMIYNYFKTNYKVVEKEKLLYEYNIDEIAMNISKNENKSNNSTNTSKNSNNSNNTFVLYEDEIKVKIFRKIIQDKNNDKKYYYYFVKYNFDSNKVFNKTYDYPILLIPVSSKITWFGVYDCYTYTSKYFCKPMDYINYIGDIKELDKKRIINKGYYFFGDILSGYII